MLSGVFVGTNVDTKPWLGRMVDSHTTNIGRTNKTAICFFFKKTMLCIYSYQTIINPSLCIQSTFFTAFILKKNSPTKYRAVPQFIYCLTCSCPDFCIYMKYLPLDKLSNHQSIQQISRISFLKKSTTIKKYSRPETYGYTCSNRMNEEWDIMDKLYTLHIEVI